LLWREALTITSSSDICLYFITALIQNNRPSEAGEIVERLGDYSSAVELYLEGRSIAKALRLYQTVEFETCNTYNHRKKRLSAEEIRELIRSTAISYLKGDLSELNSLQASLEKYKERLCVVRARLNENMTGTQTTFSYSSMKSSKKALLKDRPGGVFENEYVLNKIRDTVMAINDWRIRCQELLDVFDALGNVEMSEALQLRFKSIDGTLKADVERIWDYRRTDVDFELPNVPMPVLSAYFD